MEPEAMRVGDIAGAAGFHGESRAIKTAHGDDDAVRMERRRVNERIQAATCPNLAASRRFERCDAFGKGHDETRLAGLFDDRWCGPRADPHRALSVFRFAEITPRFVHA